MVSHERLCQEIKLTIYSSLPSQLLVGCQLFARLNEMRNLFFCLGLMLSLPACGKEIKFDFSDFSGGSTPTNFVSVLAGAGQPGEYSCFIPRRGGANLVLVGARRQWGSLALGGRTLPESDVAFPTVFGPCK